MKGEKILHRFNKVCKNLKGSPINEILTDFKKIDSFNNFRAKWILLFTVPRGSCK